MKDVTITLDRERKLVCDFNAMIAFEEQTGEHILAPDFWPVFKEKPKLSILRGLLWACLQQDQPGITIDQVGKLMSFKNAPEIFEKVLLAFNDGEEPPNTADETSNAETKPAALENGCGSAVPLAAAQAD